MAGRAGIHRSVNRSTQVLFRLSPDDKELLRQRADEAGLTIQAYLERCALGRANAVPLAPGRPRQSHEEELPLTG